MKRSRNSQRLVSSQSLDETNDKVHSLALTDAAGSQTSLECFAANTNSDPAVQLRKKADLPVADPLRSKRCKMLASDQVSVLELSHSKGKRSSKENSPQSINVGSEPLRDVTPGRGQPKGGKLGRTTTNVDRQRRLSGVHYRDHHDIEEVSQGFTQAMKRREIDYHPDPNYISRQGQLTFRMRSILIDWMIEVSQEYMLRRESLHYSINYVDRYLSAEHDIQKGEFQLVGVTALFIAAKVEEIYPPRARDFALTTDGAFTASNILEMEKRMIKKLEWNLCPVTAYAWLNYYVHQLACPIRISRIEEESIEKLKVSEYPMTAFNSEIFCRAAELMDCTVLCYQSMQFLPSEIAAAALTLSAPTWMHPTLSGLSSAFCTNSYLSCLKWMELYISPLPHNALSHSRLDQIEVEVHVRDRHSMQVHHPGALAHLKNYTDMPLPLPSEEIEAMNGYVSSDADEFFEEPSQSSFVSTCSATKSFSSPDVGVSFISEESSLMMEARTGLQDLQLPAGSSMRAHAYSFDETFEGHAYLEDDGIARHFDLETTDSPEPAHQPAVPAQLEAEEEL